MVASGGEVESEQDVEPPVQVDPTGRYSRTNDILGKGAFKTVYKGFDEEEGIEVAWNQVRVSELVSSKEERERLFAEIRVLKQLKHKNIMSFYDSWLENKGYTVNFITELFTSGTLRQYRKRHKQMDSEVMKRWAWQILCGLVYLHGHTPPIIHRDLKCDNIFINGSEGVVKIGDLGLATMLRARTAPQSVLGTPEFMAPELYDEEYDDRVDVYSFGMCLLELATLEYPYSECRNAAQIYRKVTLGVRPGALAKVRDRELAEFICHCIGPREGRPRSRQLLKHPYFDSIRTEKCSIKLSAEALGVSSLSQTELCDYANIAGSSSVSRTSSGTAEMPHDNSMLLDVVLEDEEEEEERGEPEEPKLVHMPLAPHVSTMDPLPLSNQPPSDSVPSAEVMHLMGQDGAESKPGSPNPFDGPTGSGHREFKVKGRLQEDEDKLNLRLRIIQPHCAAKMVEFDFDLVSDTAMSVASEMVEEMSLSHEDAHRISLAIKEEIKALTRKGSHANDDASSFSSSSSHQGEQDGADPSGVFREVTDPRKGADLTNCSDSVTSVHAPGTSPSNGGREPMLLGSPVHDDSQPMLVDHRSSDSRSINGRSPRGEDSFFLPGSNGLQDAMLLDTAQQPEEQSRRAVVLLNGMRHGGQLRATPSVGSYFLSDGGAMHGHGLLNRTDSANQAADVEALQQELSRKRATAGFMSLPKDVDCRLPLKKLLENLHEEVESQSQQQSSLIPPASRFEGSRPQSPEAMPVPNARLPLTPTRPNLATTSLSADAAAASSPTIRPDLRRASAGDGLKRSSPRLPGLANGGQSSDELASSVSAPASKYGSRDPSPSREGLMSPMSSLGDCSVQRSKSKIDLAEVKEMRKKAALDAMKNMEFKSLEGLDTFGLTRGCSQKHLPLKAPGIAASRHGAQ